jgi:hypothetical protein
MERSGVIDQFGEEHSAGISFWIDRSVKLHPKKENGPRRKSLFGDRLYCNTSHGPRDG